jgi:hypothetical protein
MSNPDTINSIDKKRLITNKGKSLALGFHHKLNENTGFPDIILKDGQITYTSKTKFSGVWLNHNLIWDLHANNLMKKLSKFCFVIKTLRPSVNKNVLRTIHFAYFCSPLTYGILFWGNLKDLKQTF